MYNLIDLEREIYQERVPDFMILVTCTDPPLVEKHCEKYGANALWGLGKFPTQLKVFAFNDDLGMNSNFWWTVHSDCIVIVKIDFVCGDRISLN